MLTLFNLFGALFLFFGVGTAFPGLLPNYTCIVLFLAFVRY